MDASKLRPEQIWVAATERRRARLIAGQSLGHRLRSLATAQPPANPAHQPPGGPTPRLSPTDPYGACSKAAYQVQSVERRDLPPEAAAKTIEQLLSEARLDRHSWNLCCDIVHQFARFVSSLPRHLGFLYRRSLRCPLPLQRLQSHDVCDFGVSLIDCRSAASGGFTTLVCQKSRRSSAAAVGPAAMSMPQQNGPTNAPIDTACEN
jgi:hypothetical protein